ncbi:MAG: 3-oxoacyl-ACP reductase FabG [Desulfobulbaceae bacterium]|nr:3-oxoacyl-ACP reductase FabG [Desulfobulbaceae bacterium]HIJ78972.1 3-oxoacyl-ACP reductase FabG [Deltaproteobacteria bacterium]
MTKSPIAFISGASRGIGAAIALRLADSGYDLWLNYHSAHDAAQALKDKIEEKGQGCLLLPFDVADEQAVSAALEPLLADEVPFAFIHNAGITRDTLLPLMRRAEWDTVLEVHLTGFFLLARLLSKFMVSKRKGRIIAISSVSGETGQAGQVNYSAAKAGLIGASKALARELARRNILVNVVSPGLIDTEMIKDVPLDKVLPMVPLNRVGTVEEVAGVVNFLLSPDAGYMTGQVIGVNGGLYI